MVKYLIAYILISLCNSVFSQCIVTGKVINATAGSEVMLTKFKSEFEFSDVILAKTKLDSKGTFTIKITIDKPINSKITIGDHSIYIWQSPFDSLVLSVDYRNFNKTLQFKGIGSADNNYIASETREGFANKAVNPGFFKRVKEFVAYFDSLTDANQRFLKNHDNPEFSSSFRNYITATTKYRYIYPREMLFRANSYGYINIISERKIPDGYFYFLLTMDIDNQTAAGNPDYGMALQCYFNEINDPNLYKVYPDSISITGKTQLDITRDYIYRKSVLKGKVLDYGLSYFMSFEIENISADVEFKKKMLTDYRSVCKNNDYISIINKMYANKSKVEEGSIAAEFNLIDINGVNISLSSLKGKTVLIEFWATWCKPCIASMPYTQEMLDKFKGNKDVVFLYVNIDDDFDRWKNYLSEKSLKGIHLYANKEQSTELLENYTFDGLPHTIILDRTGRIALSSIINLEQAEKKLLDISK